MNVHNEQNGENIVTDELRAEFENFWEEHRVNPLIARDHIIASMCPQIFGCYVVKLAVTLVLIGGVRRVDESGTKVRGESHLLLVGDPGKKVQALFQMYTFADPRSSNLFEMQNARAMSLHLQ